MTEATATELMRLARNGRVEDLESAWLESMSDPGPAEGYLAALDALEPDLRRPVETPLLNLLLEAYGERSAHADILALARVMYGVRGRVPDLTELVGKAIESLYSGEEWYGLFQELSGMAAEGADDLPRSSQGDSLERFDRLLALLPGRVVFHRSGWAEGLVTAIDLADQSFTVRFRRDGAVRSMPFTSGLDVLEPLAERDLRARLLVDTEGLEHDAKEDPAKLVRTVARLHKNRCAVKEIKEWLCGTVIAEKSWSSWWRKAKAAALADPFLAVDNPQRPVFVLRQRALTPEEEMASAMDRADDLPSLLEVVRGPLSMDPEEDLRQAMLARVAAKAEDPTAGPVALAEAALILGKNGIWDADRVSPILDGMVGERSGFGELASALPTGSRRDLLDAFVAARPGLWSDAVIGELPSVPGGLLGPVCDRLVAEERGSALANRFHIFLIRPSGQPETTISLAKRFASGKFDGVEGAPDVVEVVSGLMRLAETQAPKAERGDKPAKAIMRELAVLLAAAKKGLVVPFVAAGTRSDLEGALSVLARVRTMPDGIVAALRTEVERRFPDLAPREDAPFWERSGSIFCTRAGILRRQHELRVLLDEKIPENSADIGRAASYGDLSENYEWKSAIEMQRQLTEKAAAMEAELRVAQSLDDQEFDTEVVSPGSRVIYLEDGVEKEVTILGPWDEGENVISYRAPLGAGLLGAKVGEVLTVKLPASEIRITVKALELVLEPADS